MHQEVPKSASFIKYAIFPALAAAVPVLHYFEFNRGYYPFTSALPAVVGSCGVAIILYFVLALIFRKPLLASTIACLVVAIFYGVGRIMPISFDGFLLLLPAIASICFLSFVIMKRASQGLQEKLGNAFRFFVVAFFILTLIPILIQPKEEFPEMYPARRYDSVEVPPASVNKPDVYYIILDAYARTDVLEKKFSFPNQDFVQGLESKGFKIVPRAVANYSQTVLSVSSSLEGSATSDVLDPTVGDLRYRRAVAGSISGTSSIKRFFKKAGYHISAVESGFGLTEPRFADAVFRRPFRYNPFLAGFVDTTPLKVVESVEMMGLGAHRNLVEYQLATVPDMASEARPDFIFAHVVCPHAPYVFNTTSGGALSRPTLTGIDRNYKAGPNDDALFREVYVEQVQGLNARVTAMVDRILSKHGKDVWIIIQSDHGPRSPFQEDSLGSIDFTQLMPVLMAIHQPETVKTSLPPDMSPVNLFAYVLNSQWNCGIEYLPDFHRYSPIRAPWRLTRLEREEILQP